MPIVDNRWVFRVKYKPDGSINRFKARLIAKGFQQTQGLDYFETFSPIIKQPTVRVVITLAVTDGWDVQQIDVNNAFLNGDLQETVFMHQPPACVDQAKPTHVCRLIKALYGLKQAQRAWYDKLHSYLVKWGFKNSRNDTSLFYYNTGTICLYLLVYVDDILITGNSNSEIQRVIRDLNSEFALKSLGSLGSFSHFLGFESHRDHARFCLTQSKYAYDLLVKAHLVDTKPCPTSMISSKPLVADDGSAPLDSPTVYRLLVRGLQYLTHTRPDLSFAVNKLSQYLQTLRESH